MRLLQACSISLRLPLAEQTAMTDGQMDRGRGDRYGQRWGQIQTDRRTAVDGKREWQADMGRQKNADRLSDTRSERVSERMREGGRKGGMKRREGGREGGGRGGGAGSSNDLPSRSGWLRSCRKRTIGKQTQSARFDRCLYQFVTVQFDHFYHHPLYLIEIRPLLGHMQQSCCSLGTSQLLCSGTGHGRFEMVRFGALKCAQD